MTSEHQGADPFIARPTRLRCATVAWDVMAGSGRRTLAALIACTTDVQVLAAPGKTRLRRKLAELRNASTCARAVGCGEGIFTQVKAAELVKQLGCGRHHEARPGRLRRLKAAVRGRLLRGPRDRGIALAHRSGPEIRKHHGHDGGRGLHHPRAASTASGTRVSRACAMSGARRAGAGRAVGLPRRSTRRVQRENRHGSYVSPPVARRSAKGHSAGQARPASPSATTLIMHPDLCPPCLESQRCCLCFRSRRPPDHFALP